MFSISLPRGESCAFELTWKNIAEAGRPHMEICRTRSCAWWIPKATDTHPQYVIFEALPLQQWLREPLSLLRCTCPSFRPRLFAQRWTVPRLFVPVSLHNGEQSLVFSSPSLCTAVTDRLTGGLRGSELVWQCGGERSWQLPASNPVIPLWPNP